MPDLLSLLATFALFAIAIVYSRTCERLTQGRSGATPMLENVLLLALCTALLVYLVYAMLYPEKF